MHRSIINWLLHPASDFHFFDPEMDACETARRALEFDLRNALERDEFYLVYQPIVDASSNEVTSFEALKEKMTRDSKHRPRKLDERGKHL